MDFSELFASFARYLYVFAAVHQLPNEAFIAPFIAIIVVFLPLILWLVKERRSLEQQEAEAADEAVPAMTTNP